MYHVSCIMYHVSCIMYHVSCIMYHFYLFIYFANPIFQKLPAPHHMIWFGLIKVFNNRHISTVKFNGVRIKVLNNRRISWIAKNALHHKIKCSAQTACQINNKPGCFNWGKLSYKKNVRKADIVRFWRHPSPSSRDRGKDEDEDGHHDCYLKKIIVILKKIIVIKKWLWLKKNYCDYDERCDGAKCHRGPEHVFGQESICRPPLCQSNLWTVRKVLKKVFFADANLVTIKTFPSVKSNDRGRK